MASGTLEAPEATKRETDEYLLLEYRVTGDRDLFTQLVRRYERELFNYLRRYLGDAEMAEDAFQTTWLNVHLKREQFEEGRPFRPWLYAIGMNQAIDAQRRNKRHRMVSLDGGRSDTEEGGDITRLAYLLMSDAPDPVDTAMQQELEQQLHKARKQLTKKMKDVVELVYDQDLTYREAADELNIPVGTVKSRLHAAILKLNEAMSPAEEEEEETPSAKELEGAA